MGVWSRLFWLFSVGPPTKTKTPPPKKKSFSKFHPIFQRVFWGHFLIQSAHDRSVIEEMTEWNLLIHLFPELLWIRFAVPDRPFPNFRASKSGDQRIFWSSGTFFSSPDVVKKAGRVLLSSWIALNRIVLSWSWTTSRGKSLYPDRTFHIY